MRLTFADRTAPGITRKPRGDDFLYYSPRGRLIVGAKALERIAKLVIPPAWRDVWISASVATHIQATGVDAKGRLQYIYHPHFRQHRETQKFSRLIKFAQCLPKLREAVRRDMRLPGIPRERALATLVYLLEATLIRVGNAEYARVNESFGLSTLDARHVVVEGTSLTFEFTGKSGKPWRVTIRDRRAAAVMRACQELPGQRLFQYLDETGRRRAVTSADVNAYLRQAAGRRISAKDFRTWSGTLLCAVALGKEPPSEAQRLLKRQVAQAMREVAKALGNTPAVCRSSYVHPGVFDAHRSGELHRLITKAERLEAVEGRLKPQEQAVLQLLRAAERLRSKSAAVGVEIVAVAEEKSGRTAAVAAISVSSPPS